MTDQALLDAYAEGNGHSHIEGLRNVARLAAAEAVTPKEEAPAEEPATEE